MLNVLSGLFTVRQMERVIGARAEIIDGQRGRAWKGSEDGGASGTGAQAGARPAGLEV